MLNSSLQSNCNSLFLISLDACLRFTNFFFGDVKNIYKKKTGAEICERAKPFIMIDFDSSIRFLTILFDEKKKYFFRRFISSGDGCQYLHS